jgi:hypothetical protein
VKRVHWSAHALQNLADREIEREQADGTLAAPEFVVAGQAGRKVLMQRYVDRILHQQMLLRMIVEETMDEIVVVTLYKTSQIEKYLKGLVP